MWFLALRHLFSRPQQTVLTFLGIILGAAGYVVFSGIQIGYQEYIIDRLINNDAYVRISPRDENITEETFRDIFFPGAAIKWVTPPSGRLFDRRLIDAQGWFDKLEGNPEVVAYSPQLLRDVIFSNGKFSIPGRLVGIDAARQARVTNIEQDVSVGNLHSIGQGDSLIMIGVELMRKLGARLNGNINVVIGDGTVTPVKIVAVFKTGVRQIDAVRAYASLSTVQKVTKSSGEVSDIVVRLPYINRAASVATGWQRLSKDKVESWDQANEINMAMITTQNIVRNVTTLVIMLVVAFGIYNILNMVVNQKKKEIAILRSIGYNQRDTIFLFLIQGVLLGVTGALLGLLAGYSACAYIETIKLNVGIGHMLISWDAAIYIKAFLIVVGSTLIASFIPARAAGRLSPIDIIRGSQ